MTCLWAVRRRRRRGGRRPSSKRLRLRRGLGCHWTRRARGERGRRRGSGVFRSPRPTPRFAALVVDIWQWLMSGPRAVFYAGHSSSCSVLLMLAGPRWPECSLWTVVLRGGCARRRCRFGLHKVSTLVFHLTLCSFWCRQAKVLGISAGMEQKDSYVAYLWPRSLSFQAAACAWLVFLVTILLVVFPSVVDMLKMLGILVGLDQKDSSQRYSWFLLGDHFRKMFRILRNAWFDSGFTLLRQFSELLKKLTLSTCRWTLVFQRNAWFDS